MAQITLNLILCSLLNYLIILSKNNALSIQLKNIFLEKNTLKNNFTDFKELASNENDMCLIPKRKIGNTFPYTTFKLKDIYCFISTEENCWGQIILLLKGNIHWQIVKSDKFPAAIEHSVFIIQYGFFLEQNFDFTKMVLWKSNYPQPR